MVKFRDIAARVALAAGVDVQAARVAVQVAINQRGVGPVDKMAISEEVAVVLESRAAELLSSGGIPDFLAAIEHHAQALGSAQLAVETARAARDDAIRKAHTAGVAIKDIQAAAGGITRVMVHNIVNKTA